MTELKNLKDLFQELENGKINQEEFESQFPSIVDGIEDEYSDLENRTVEAEDKAENAEHDKDAADGYSSELETENGELENRLENAIESDNLLDEHKMDIIKRLYSELSITQLENIERENNLQPDWHPDKLKTA